MSAPSNNPPLTVSPGVDFYDTLATPKQMSMTRAKYGDRADTEAQRRYGVNVDSLTKGQAYTLITTDAPYRRLCSNCNTRLVYDDDRDDEGNIEQAYYYCPDHCGYAEGA
jgi:hypothetical protein